MFLTLSDVPEPVRKFVEQDYVEYGYKLKRLTGFEVGDNLPHIVVPNVTYDVSYVAHHYGNINAKKYRTVEFGGIACDFYERENEQEKGYVIYIDSEENCIYYIEV